MSWPIKVTVCKFKRAGKWEFGIHVQSERNAIVVDCASKPVHAPIEDINLHPDHGCFTVIP